MNIIELQLELKELAVRIRELKSTRKEVAHGYVQGLARGAHDARHKHIAYCLLRGLDYKQVENRCRPDNKPDMDYVNRIMEDYNEKTICTCMQEAE